MMLLQIRCGQKREMRQSRHQFEGSHGPLQNPLQLFQLSLCSLVALQIELALVRQVVSFPQPIGNQQGFLSGPRLQIWWTPGDQELLTVVIEKSINMHRTLDFVSIGEDLRAKALLSWMR